MSSHVIDDAFNKCLAYSDKARQSGEIFIPILRTNSLFQLFWPKTTRDIRDAIDDFNYKKTKDFVMFT